jgi:hypothetical protein
MLGLLLKTLYCQAQPQFQLSWAELALVLISPAARPSAAVRNSSETAGKEQNLLPKSCRNTLLELKTIKEILKYGRGPPWKTSLMEDDLSSCK